MMDGYRNLSRERIPTLPRKEAAVERFMVMSDDRLSSQIFHRKRKSLDEPFAFSTLLKYLFKYVCPPSLKKKKFFFLIN
ncbi:hypothetical protein PUN28_017133 [Cardiocondyla obscurior]|uniref:Uncharacterized protein n=1 Tax=Cardiocondyla obscurior TaxID=286306 RepID=A0AAW2EKE4_9HYME